MSKEIKEKRLILVFGFSVDVLNLLSILSGISVGSSGYFFGLFFGFFNGFIWVFQTVCELLFWSFWDSCFWSFFWGIFWIFVRVLNDKMMRDMRRDGGEAQRMPKPCVTKVLRSVVGNCMGVCVWSKHKLCAIQAWIVCWHVVDKSKIGYLGNILEPNTSPLASIHHLFLTLTNNQRTLNTLNKMLGYLDKLIKI